MPPVATVFPIVRLVFFVLVAVVALGVAGSACARADTTGWSVEITPDGELFPVLDLSQAPSASATARGGGNGLVIVRVAGAGRARHLRIDVDTDALEAPAVVEADAPAGASIELRPRLHWDVRGLRALREPRRQTLHVTLRIDDGDAQMREVPVRVHPLDDALYFVREGRDRVDLGWVFAAYVDPDDAIVDAIVADARAIDVDFDRRGDDAAARNAKALAVWSALMRHGLRYAPGDPALSRGPEVYSQRVRLLGDVWRERRANCLDGSVLIASVFERIGMPASIVLVPGHAFVGYRVDGADRGAGHVEFLETTLLGESAGGSDATTRFAAARAEGRARWRRAAARFARAHGPDYALIDIGTARSYGIIPLRAHGDSRPREDGAGAAHGARSPRRSSPK
jgi:hypothetical protein